MDFGDVPSSQNTMTFELLRDHFFCPEAFGLMSGETLGKMDLWISGLWSLVKSRWISEEVKCRFETAVTSKSCRFRESLGLVLRV